MEGINAYVNKHTYKHICICVFLDYRYIWESIVVWKLDVLGGLLLIQ
jgi:hypothetical protein